MKPRTKRILNLLLIVGTLAIVLIIGLNDNGLPDTIKHLTSISLRSTLLCIVCWLIYNFCDALSIWYFLRRRNVRLSIGYVYLTSIIAAFYCNVTPGATGGQPMQIYYLHKQGAPTGLATSGLIGHFFAYQASIVVFGSVFWLTHVDFVAKHVGDYMWVLIVFFIYNIVVIGILVAVCFYQPAVHLLIRTAIKIGTKLRIAKNPEESLKKWTETAHEFHASLRDMFRNPLELLIHLLIGAVQIVSLMTIVWLIYIGMGFREASYTQIFTLNILEFITAANTPLPGASGMHEWMFTEYFKEFFKDGTTFAALLLWRFFTFYITLIVGSVVVVVIGLRSGKKLREVAAIQDDVEAAMQKDDQQLQDAEQIES